MSSTNHNELRSNRFQKVITDHASKLQKRYNTNNIDGTTTSSNFLLQEKEEEVLNKIYRNFGHWQGLAATVVSFFVIRNGTKRIATAIIQRRQQQGKRNANANIRIGHENILQTLNFPLRVLKFTLDVSTTLVLGGTVSLYCTNIQEIRNLASSIPLLEGTSTISNEFCPVMIKEYKRQLKAYGSHPNLNTSSATNKDDPFLRAYIDFSYNCIHRLAMENQLRKELGIYDKTVPIPIPPGGVQITIPTKENDDAVVQFYKEKEETATTTTTTTDVNGSATQETKDSKQNGEETTKRQKRKWWFW